jgi:hypothetical protein
VFGEKRMNLRTAHETLKFLGKDPQSPEIRVSSRWLQASMAVEYDLLLRLQILEGAAGVRVDSWWKKPKSQALTSARKFFENSGLNPEWLAERAQSLFNVLQRTLSGIIHSYHLTIEPFEVLNNSLMGLPIDPTDTDSSSQILRQPYQAGKFLAQKIKSGEETPQSVGSGVLANMLKKKVVNLARHPLKQLQEDDQGRTRDIVREDLPKEWEGAEEANASRYLTGLFYDLSDPLAKEIRDLMRQNWIRDPYMPYWLDQLEGHKDTSYASVAEHFGIASSSFHQRHWIPAWREFTQALYRNRILMEKINHRLVIQHLEPIGEELPLEALEQALHPLTKRAASLDCVISRYVLLSSSR